MVEKLKKSKSILDSKLNSRKKTIKKQEIEKKITNDKLKNKEFITKDIPYTLKQFPIGIKFLIIFSALNAILFIYLAIKFPYLMYFGTNLEGISASILSFITATIYLTIIYGMFKRKAWTVLISISWYVFNIFSSLISLLFLNKTIMGIMYDFFIYGFAISAIINMILIWYMFKKRYFFQITYPYGNEKTTYHDKLFIGIISIFSGITIIIGIILMSILISKLSTSLTSNGTKLIEFKTVQEGINYCSSIDEKDLCFLSFSVLLQGKIKDSYLVEVCEHINSTFLKYTCYEGLSVK